MSVNRAWAAYGMGHVIVAYMEGGVNWKLGDSNDLRDQAYLNTGELPYPQDAAGQTHGTYDLNGDGIVNVEDYVHDSRVGRANPQAGGITPEDLIIAFGHCQIVSHLIAQVPEERQLRQRRQRLPERHLGLELPPRHERPADRQHDLPPRQRRVRDAAGDRQQQLRRRRRVPGLPPAVGQDRRRGDRPARPRRRGRSSSRSTPARR